MKKMAVAMLIAVTLIISSAPVFAYQDEGMDMTMDVLIVRPVGLAATVLGTALFIVALPFAIASGSVGATACALVVMPCKYTFVRPIGDFSPEWESGNCRSGQPKQ
jgi:ABC-type molybdate transport system permease subunit